MTLLITDGLPRGLGVLELDNRASGGKMVEYETYTCSHCEAVVVLNPRRTRERYKCQGCRHYVCDNCAAKLAEGQVCYTYAQRVQDYMEAVARQTNSPLIILP